MFPALTPAIIATNSQKFLKSSFKTQQRVGWLDSLQWKLFYLHINLSDELNLDTWYGNNVTGGDADNPLMVHANSAYFCIHYQLLKKPASDRDVYLRCQVLSRLTPSFIIPWTGSDKTLGFGGRMNLYPRLFLWSLEAVCRQERGNGSCCWC